MKKCKQWQNQLLLLIIVILYIICKIYSVNIIYVTILGYKYVIFYISVPYLWKYSLILEAWNSTSGTHNIFPFVYHSWLNNYSYFPKNSDVFPKVTSKFKSGECLLMPIKT